MFEVLKYIHENIANQLSVMEVSHHFGYSNTYFCEKFRDFTGRTFVEYVRYYRMQLAAMDIIKGKKISDVAMDYGYESIGGFNKAFLCVYGCLAREYCKRTQESQLYYERRKLSMYQLTDRCELLRAEAVSGRNYDTRYCLHRHVHLTNGLVKHKDAGLTNMELTAKGIVHILEKFVPVIMPGECIVGVNFGDGAFGESYKGTNDEAGLEIMRANGFSEEDIETYFSVKGNERACYRDFCEVEFSERELGARREWSGIGRCVDSNHTVLAYDKVLKLGFEGLLKEVEYYEAKNGSSAFYRSVKELCVAAGLIGDKYAQEAKRLLTMGDSQYNKKDLETIVSVCSRVPRKPASNFLEAVQAVWFAHIINTWEDCINANSLGRLDQILYPYYLEDIEKGVISKEQAFEIICCLWIKLYRDYDVQQSCVGGTAPDGSSQVNELSYMMLDATEQLNFIRCLSVRYSSNTEKAFVKRAMEVVGHLQKGVPFFFNDDVMIPSLISKGICPEDAYNYTQIGCVETVIPGKANPHAVTGITNLLKAIEYVLCNGQSMMHPELLIGSKTGALNKFTSFETFVRAVKMQISEILDLTCSQIRKSRDAAAINSPKPFKSLLTEGCIENGRDFNDAGAKYDYYQVMLGGIPNLADSLMVIKKYVYEEKRYTLQQLKDILVADFPDESVRLEFVNKVSKFGNDIDEVDMVAADIISYSCDILEQLSEKYQLSFHAQPFTYLWMIDHGRECAASPDGRRKGEVIAYSMSPMQGRDFNGLTAVLNSLAKMPTKRTPGTTSAIVEVDPKLFTEQNVGILTDILLSSSEKGLCNVQFNTVDAETLIEAQKYPEKYNNLAVRVSGFSQKFNLLDVDLQNHIIGRTKHKCL